MKSHILSVSLFSLASAFSTKNRSLIFPSLRSSHGTYVGSNIVLSAEESATVSASEKKRPLSPKEIIAQQRAKQGLPDLDKHPKIYSDELLEDMKEILLLLEKRVKEGQGSIASAEVEKFVSMSNNVLVEMKQKEYERIEDITSSSGSPAPDAISSSNTATANAGSEEFVKKATVDAAVETPTANIADDEEEPIYNPEEEGPAYDPAGGQGSIPKDTTNTYIIPGMDEMSPEEYRDALQKSIIDRQDRRKATGTYGNRNTWDYLNNLGGDTGVLKKDELED